ncbi:hypothetical protein [Acetivibrio clariflavus]|uniref:Uncharacterized protein n=1 Tax=Acetivibrio clariflavus (strain DSM 19732 / NBRC 101661 / EBR45) TaxID=720554 RepID=G8M392_ACECE|nr:hypothetical protein [Acetivibrio clariflavus]AEV70412.1 hypothetical protein Clocl_3974 [Acetivibrio clariflavus DSM 19732]HOQ00057.1 hypothetical protein [Acetivibrio clariflavus]HPU40825.1 hypothetical protein [Acetivibrio clariflavus]
MKKRCSIIILIAILIGSLTVSYLIIRKNNCNNLIMSATLIGEGYTASFDENGLISYKSLSSRLRRLVDEKTFRSIKTWFDADEIFQQIQPPEKLTSSYTLTYNKPIELNGKKYLVNYNVYFVDSIFGYKIDYIDIDIQPQL